MKWYFINSSRVSDAGSYPSASVSNNPNSSIIHHSHAAIRTRDRWCTLVVVGHYFIWHARVLTDVDTGAVVSGQQQVTVKGEHMNVAQKSVMVLCQQVDRSPG